VNISTIFANIYPDNTKTLILCGPADILNSYVDKIKETNIPVLLCFGKKDIMVPIWMAWGKWTDRLEFPQLELSTSETGGHSALPHLEDIVEYITRNDNKKVSNDTAEAASEWISSRIVFRHVAWKLKKGLTCI